MNEPPLFMRVKDAAKHLQINYKVFYGLLKAGRGPPHFRIGGSIRIPRQDFQEWIKNGGTPSVEKVHKPKRKVKCTASR